MKYKVGDLLATDLYLYFVEEVKSSRYYLVETGTGFRIWWEILGADNDNSLKKVA